MMFFAHTGITLGAAMLARQGCKRLAAESSAACSSRRSKLFEIFLWPDYRLVLIGSLLPDIIDKPLGTWLLRDTLSSGRIYAHTLLFASLVLAVGLWLCLARRRSGWAWLGLGSFAHLAMDRMWFSPDTLFWPLYGISFRAVNTDGWVARVFLHMFQDPGVYIPEIIGLIVLALFAARLLASRKVLQLIKSGAVR